MLARTYWRRFLATGLAALLVATAAEAGKKKDRNRSDEDDDDESYEESAATAGPVTPRAPYLQSVGGDSALVVWDSPGEGAPAVDFGKPGKLDRTSSGSSEGTRRVAVLRGLAPGTQYLYRVRLGDKVIGEGPAYAFYTDGGPTDRNFSFFVTGDIGDGEGQQQVTAHSILAATPRPELGILAGDIVYGKGESRDYDANLMRPWAELLATVSVWPALGNHDWGSDPETNFRREWYLPGNEHWFSFNWGTAHFIALDSRDGDLYDPEAQIAWLERDLQAHANAEWKFVYFHHPGITCTYKKNCEAVVQHVLPLMDRYRVDVVFNGHAHTYERLYPLRDGKPVDVDQDPNYTDPNGTIYVVSGAGAKVKEGKPTKRCGPTAFFKDETILWTQVLVNGERCTIRTVESTSGKLVDTVTITKTGLAQSQP